MQAGAERPRSVRLDGAKVKRHREALRLAQKELKAHGQAIPIRTVQKAEASKTIEWETAEKIAAALDVRVEDLLPATPNTEGRDALFEDWWRKKRLIILAAVVGAAVLGAVIIWWRGKLPKKTDSPPPGRILITKPADGDQVGRSTDVCVSALPAELNHYLIVEVFGDLHNQALLSSSGEEQCKTATFGNSTTERGTDFRIYVLSTGRVLKIGQIPADPNDRRHASINVSFAP